MLPLDQEAIEIAPSPILSKEHYCLTYIPCYSPLSLFFPLLFTFCLFILLCAVAMALLRFISYDLWVTFSSHLDLLIFATRSCKCSLKWKINEKMLQYSLSIAVARVQIIRIFTMRTRFVENYIHLSTILQSNEKNAVHMFRIEV